MKQSDREHIFEIFPWNENFGTDIPVIDEQHQQLVHILNKLASGLASLQEDELLDEVFLELTDYAGYHFKSEEEIWEKHFSEDERYLTHLKTHHKFTEELLAIKNNSKGTLNEKIHEVVSFLTHWLAYHILDTDKRMAKIVLALEAGQTLEQAKVSSDEAMTGSMGVLIKTVLSMYDKVSSRSLALMREKALREQAEQRLDASEERWKFMVESSGESIWDWDMSKANYAESSFPVLKLFDDMIIKQGNEIHPADLEAVKLDFNSHIAGKTDFYVNKHRRVTPDGHWSWVLSRGKVVTRDGEGNPTRMVGMHSDITEREIASLIYEHSSQGMFVSDAENKIVNINSAFTAITGYTLNEVVGKDPKFLSSGKQSKNFYKQLWSDLQQKNQWCGEVWNKRKNGELYAEVLTIKRIAAADGSAEHYIALFMDITEQTIANEKIFKYAYYDLLTGLPNRALLSDRFKQAVSRSKRTGHQLAVCFLDIDNFKPINDIYGHEAGDLVLIEVANRIEVSIRAEDTASRLGGDEFVLLLNDISSLSDAESRVERIVRELSKSLEIELEQQNLTCSIGMTLYPDDNADIDVLIRHADQAMYMAKIDGKNRTCLFNASDNQQSIVRQAKRQRLKEALLGNELQLYYQPKVNMATGKVFGAEALIRWNHPEDGLISPLQFLPLVDGTELDSQIGEWVMNESVRQLALWQQEGIDLQMSINISSNHLQSANFFREIERALSKHPSVRSSQLQIEILESSALGDIDRISSIIKTCQEALKVDVALDDFGTGYSSLAHLRNLSAKVIKIDQSFVRDMLDDPDDYAIINGVIGLAGSFNREVIAEGVESTTHGKLLLLMGCNNAQGFGIAKPMPADVFSKWHQSYQPNQEWLAIGNVAYSPFEQNNKILCLTLERWYQTFVSNVMSELDELHQWPIMDGDKCHCSIWVQRARQEGFYTGKALLSIEEAHEEMHSLAYQLYELYQGGEVQAARNGIEVLKKAFEKQLSLLS